MTSEAVATQQIPDLLVVACVVSKLLHQILDGSFIHRKHVDKVLAVASYAQAMVAPDHAFCRLQFAHDQSQEGGLSGSVRPHDADP